MRATLFIGRLRNRYVTEWRTLLRDEATLAFFDQHAYGVRFDWGERGLEALGPTSDTIVIVDVLSFTTSIDIAVSRGASVFPYRYRDPSAEGYALQKQAILPC